MISHPRPLALVALVALVFISPAWTQEKKAGKKYALLIGVCEYANKELSTLDCTENDAEELARQLEKKEAGFAKVVVLSTTRGKKDGKQAPTAANIRTALKELFAGKEKEDTVLIGLAGHGILLSVDDPQAKAASKTFPFFCPADAKFNDTDYTTGKSPTLINLEQMLEDLGACRAGAKYLLIDACRNEVAAQARGSTFELKEGAVPEGVAVLFSCRKNQRAWESKKLGKGHGVFFHFVIEALGGKAMNERGEVTWNRVSDYVVYRVEVEVPKLIGLGATQTPHEKRNLVGTPPPLLLYDAATFETKPKPKPGKEVSPPAQADLINSIGMKLVRIPAGSFTMGSSKERKGFAAGIADFAMRKEFEKFMEEEKEHRVVLTEPFFLGAFEVTQKQFSTVMKQTPSYFSPDGGGRSFVRGLDTSEFPVESINWQKAAEFCQKLSQLAEEEKAGRIYRLPTEAEWEYACRAGTTTTYHYGDELPADAANFGYLVGLRGMPQRTTKVGSYKPNAFGLYDMHGNVAEWCNDWHSPEQYSQSILMNPPGPGSGTEKVFRGGAWNAMERHCRSANRGRLHPSRLVMRGLGFRVVCEVVAPK